MAHRRVCTHTHTHTHTLLHTHLHTHCSLHSQTYHTKPTNGVHLHRSLDPHRSAIPHPAKRITRSPLPQGAPACHCRPHAGPGPAGEHPGPQRRLHREQRPAHAGRDHVPDAPAAEHLSLRPI